MTQNNQKSEKPATIDLNDSGLYLNREIGHLQFNLRVLELAMNESYPLLERLRFLLIFSTNLDEFYEIRVAGLKKQVDFNREQVELDGLSPKELLETINRQVHEAVTHQYEILNQVLIPALRKENIRFLQRTEWSPELTAWSLQYFRSEVLPVISPLGLDQAHPFPRLVNKSLNFILSLEGKDAFGRDSGMAIVPVPRSLPRLIKVPDNLNNGGDNFVFLSSIIHAHIEELFPGMIVKECHQFRVIRNADLEMNAAEVEDIALALKGELHTRRFGTAIKLEVSKNCSETLSHYLLEQFSLTDAELFRIDGPVSMERMVAAYEMVDRPDLCFPSFTPAIPGSLIEKSAMFDAIAKDDILLHHPYQSFTPIIDLLRQAAKDPDVLAIKQTLYRTGKASELVEALTEAARNGKEVTTIIELRARFDEEENLQFASRLQEAGALVVYGVLGHKTHAKMLLIVRREGKNLKRYVHLGTGNYHPGNARIYTDYSLLTSNDQICEDVHRVFQQLTGMGKTPKPQLLLNAPFTLRKGLTNLIQQEIEAAQNGKPARIIAKINGLTDPKIIRQLYQASQAGVQIDLIVRGTCCLKPDIKDVSENIRVVSIIGRFLEHSRVYYFQNNEYQVFCSSADFMERNLYSRVEICFPIVKQKLAVRIKRELDKYLQDNSGSWVLHNDGTYKQRTSRSEATSHSVQLELLADLSG